MNLETMARNFGWWLAGSDSWWNFTKKMKHRRDVRAWYAAVCVTPLYPMVGWADHDVTPRPLDAFFGASRDPVALLYTWHRALALAGRVDTVTPLYGVTIFIKGDGVQDKMNGVHVGFTFCHDTNFFSSHAQQDFILGRLSEKNQFHMALVARYVRDLIRFCEAHGVTVLVGGDWEWLRTTGRGFMYSRTGAGWTLPSKSMFFNGFHGQFAHTQRSMPCAAVTPPMGPHAGGACTDPWHLAPTRRYPLVPVAPGVFQG